MSTDVPGQGGLPPEVVSRLLAYVERTSDAIGVTDDRGNVLYLNAAARTRLGLVAGDRDPGEPLTTADLFPDEAFDVYYEQIRPAVVRGEAWNGYLPVRGGAGTVVDMWVTVVGQALAGGEVAWLVISARDVTEWRHVREELGRVATHDELTGLAGRVLLMDRLDVALARTERTAGVVAALFIDLDDLKAVNDSHGHHAGDAVLVEVARRLQDAVRAIDTVARVGGDEFVVLLDGLSDEEEAETLATRIEAMLESESIRVEDATINLSASVGLAIGHGRADREQLLRRADAAMYEVKGGRHERRPWAGPGTAAAVAGPSVHDVAVAVTQGAVVAHYQSVVDVASGERRGIQALARWRRGDRDPLVAGEFVPVVDGTGVGFSLDLAILRNATADLAVWPAPVPPTLYVHASGRFLARPGVERFVREVLLRGVLDPARLALVVPGTLVARRAPAVLDNAWALREVGVRLVLAAPDGTAPDLAGYVDRLFGELRFGPTVLERLADDPAPVRALVDAAHDRGWSTHAVGVERPEDLDRLAQLGCDLAAGHHVDVPHEAEVGGNRRTA